MPARPIVRYSAVLAAVLFGTTATADLSAQDVWDNWSEQMSVYGQGFTTGGEVMDGDTLTISDIRIEMSDDEASVTADIGDLVLVENGDGTVTVTMADSYPITLVLTPEASDASTINLTVSQSDMALTVLGEPDAMVYDIDTASYSISVDSLAGEAAEEVDLEIAALTLLDVSGQYAVATGDLTEVRYDLDVGAMDLDVVFRETGGAGVVNLTADLADLAMAADLSIPQDMDMDADMPPFDQGLAATGGYTFGALAYAFDIDADGEAASGTATVDGGQLGVSFDYDGVAYTGETRGIDVSFLIPNEFPLPIEASMAQYGFDILIPLSQGEGAPRDARMAFNLTDLTISDMLWGLFDQQAVLPRGPLTVALGLDAKVTPFFDVLDPAQQEAMMMTDVPGELNSIELTDLTIRGAGAEITGEGSFTFDNSDLETFAGFPRPEGQATFAINGVNGLVDKLIQMGLIPQDQAMMPRMMLGMFATPVGDDMLTSTIEVNGEGHVLANGQRLR